MRENLRNYQWELAVPGLSGQNYIICAPTGSGKTCVASLVISEHLKTKKGQARVIFLANKVELAIQQSQYFQRTLCNVRVEKIIGESSANKKALLEHCGDFSYSDESSSSDSEERKFKSRSNDIIVCTGGCLVYALQHNRVKMSDFSLVIVDECHNTKKSTDYAVIMQHYIREKQAERNVPQVIGLTASPGAGDAANPSLDSVMNHLIDLCAAMDAQGGIKIVEENKSELQSFQNSPNICRCTLDGRSEDEPFITTVTSIMSMLEQTYRLVPPANSKWKPEYVSWVNRKIKEFQLQDIKRDTMSVLKTLKCLCSTLSTYYNLRFEDALAVLKQHPMASGEGATHCEKNLARVFEALQEKLKTFDRVTNPLLTRLESILEKQFRSSHQSKAIVFVETQFEAKCLNDWLSSSPPLKTIKPGMITGHQGKDGSKNVTTAERAAVLDMFRGDDINVLVSTSVLEEGIDVSACNLVVKYQRVGSEIAELQSRGRARAALSHCFTIVSNDSGKGYQQLMNERKNVLVDRVLEMMPAGELLSALLPPIQADLLSAAESKVRRLKERKEQFSPNEVEVMCGHCKEFLCNASDIQIIEGTCHHVVTDPEFVHEKLMLKPHGEPTTMKHDISKSHRIYCKSCGCQKLGILGRWWKNRKDYPVLKCELLLFKVNGEWSPYKKWKLVPFEVTSQRV